jgi:hypothetical protein
MPTSSTIEDAAQATSLPATPPAAVSAPVDPAEVASKTAIINLRLRKPSARRRARDGTVNVVSALGPDGDPEQESTRVSVELLRADEYLAIVAHDRGTRDLLKEASLPAGRRFASGSHLVLLANVERLFSELERRKVERRALVDAFVARYPAIVQDARARLKDAFDARAFPGAACSAEGVVTVGDEGLALMRASFDFDYELEVSSREAGIMAAARSGVSRAFVDRELARARESTQALVGEIRDGLRVAFGQLIDRATDMLKPGEDGERRVFRGENLARIQEFLAVFDSKNVVGDGDLAQVVAQARGILAGVSIDDLRTAKDKEAQRDKLGTALEEVQKALAPMVQAAPRRRITLDGDV